MESGRIAGAQIRSGDEDLAGGLPKMIPMTANAAARRIDSMWLASHDAEEPAKVVDQFQPDDGLIFNRSNMGGSEASDLPRLPVTTRHDVPIQQLQIVR